jgi:hypothetical protein
MMTRSTTDFSRNGENLSARQRSAGNEAKSAVSWRSCRRPPRLPTPSKGIPNHPRNAANWTWSVDGDGLSRLLVGEEGAQVAWAIVQDGVSDPLCRHGTAEGWPNWVTIPGRGKLGRFFQVTVLDDGRGSAITQAGREKGGERGKKNL